jgi:hypothetical protein
VIDVRKLNMLKSSTAAGLELTLTLLLSLGSLAFGVSTVIDHVQARRSAAWPLVDAQIVVSQVAKGCGRSGSYYPHIEYRYAPDGGQLSGTRIQFGNAPCGTKEYASAFTAQYPSGAMVKVGLNPRNIFDAVLQPGEVGTASWATLGAAAILFGVSTLFAARNLLGKGAT